MNVLCTLAQLSLPQILQTIPFQIHKMGILTHSGLWMSQLIPNCLPPPAEIDQVIELMFV